VGPPSSLRNAPTPAAALACVECRREWLRRGERWRAYVADVDGEFEVGLYCPRCAAREFDD
jgi:hypothetical protein